MTQWGLSIQERLDMHTTPEPTSGCWLFSAYKGQRYGALKVNGRMVLAHRLAWEEAHGPIPDDLCVLHKCDVPICVNPDHLFLGTQLDNIADRVRKGRNKKTPTDFCRNGHAYTAETIRTNSSGSRVCRTCRNASALRGYYKKKELRR